MNLLLQYEPVSGWETREPEEKQTHTKDSFTGAWVI